MLLLVVATSASLTLLQATINVPRDAFRDCMREATSSARTENVAADNFEAYARGKCSVQMGSLRSALIAFNVKNGMAKKAAASDADLTIDDYVASPVDKYKFMSGLNAKPAAAAAAATPPSPPSPPPPPKP